MDKVAVVNLGCPKNQIDAETMSGLLMENGFQLTRRPETADIIVVNTCGFIDKARQESIEQILAMAEHKKNGHCRQLLVTGCLVQRHYNELARELPEVDGFLGTGSVDKIIALLEGKHSIIAAPEKYDGLAEVKRQFSTFPYGYLKIAEGCNNRCSYCIIPQLRGSLRSKERSQIIAEAKSMAASGIKEIILVAQDTSQYGLDIKGKSLLPELLRDLDSLSGIQWIRLLYCYPDHITDELIDVIAHSTKLCRYLDIPLQHSHPSILQSMGRQHSPERTRELIQKLRQRVPGIALRTTFIVGYPGETQEHFQDLLDFVRWAEFDHLGAFTYSREEGTRAANLKTQVPARIKNSRYHQLMTLQQQIVLKCNQQLQGSKFTALIDSVRGGEAYARSYREAPEIDSNIIIPATACKTGEFVTVKCTGYDGYDLLGEIDNG
jgi:ribosomal protein S12 methylthiotransferase